MKPNNRTIDFERVREDNFVLGEIIEIQRDPEHKTTFKGEEKFRDCIRFKLKLDGCAFHHYSRWMTFSYGEQTNLYSKYLVNIVEGMKPDCDFDIMSLKGFKVKTMWTTKNEFQSIELIRPAEKKAPYVSDEEVIDVSPQEEASPTEEDGNHYSPFPE